MLEALARSIGMPALGANDTRRDHTLEAVDPLANALKLSFKTKPKYSFFLRAEDFFGFIQRIRNTRESMRKELDAIDRVNRIYGTETVVLGAQQYNTNAATGKADIFANAIRHDHRSGNPTTRWKDIIKLK